MWRVTGIKSLTGTGWWSFINWDLSKSWSSYFARKLKYAYHVLLLTLVSLWGCFCECPTANFFKTPCILKRCNEEIQFTITMSRSALHAILCSMHIQHSVKQDQSWSSNCFASMQYHHILTCDYLQMFQVYWLWTKRSLLILQQTADWLPYCVGLWGHAWCSGPCLPLIALIQVNLLTQWLHLQVQGWSEIW